MSTPADGGAAFPAELSNSGPQWGMSLRDYFAAKAMPQLMDSLDQSREDEIRADIAKAKVTGAYGLVAKRSYEMADAMLAERLENHMVFSKHRQ